MLSAEWDTLIRFIDARDPGFAERVRGAAADRVQAVRAAFGVDLPRAYVDFLTTLGEDTAGFRVFPNHWPVVEAILGVFEEMDGWDYHYAPDVYLPVGFEIEDDEQDETEGDVCLARREGDPDDPPVVLVDPTEETDAPSRLVLGTSLGEYVQDRAFLQYERPRRAHMLRLSAPDPDPAAAGAWTTLREVVGRLGLEALLPGGPRAFVGGDDAVATTIRRPEGLFVANLCGDDERAIRRVAETVRDNTGLDWQESWSQRDFALG